MSQNVVVQRVESDAGRGEHTRITTLTRELAGIVLMQESETLSRLLDDVGITYPADLTFTKIHQVGQDDGGPPSGSLASIASYYHGLQHGRLMIAGSPGSGKSILAMKLAQHLSREIVDADLATDVLKRRFLVPIRLSASEFAPSVDFADFAKLSPLELSARFDSWLSWHMSELFAIPAEITDRLVQEGVVLPIIDGIDEMDSSDQPPWRAIATIGAINCMTQHGMRPVILTCRSEAYDSMVEYADTPRHPLLQDATTIVVQPAATSDVAAYLSRRFPDPTGRLPCEPRWRPVIEELRNAASRDSCLAAALTNPLRLFLATAAYSNSSTHPAEMLHCAKATDLDNLLFGSFVPAAVRRDPERVQRYQAPEVLCWFRVLGMFLMRDQDMGRLRTDIRVDQAWRLIGLPARLIPASVILLISSAVFLLGGLSDVLYAIHNGQYVTIVLTAVSGFFLVLALQGSMRDSSQIQRFDLGEILGDRYERRKIQRALLRPLIYALAITVANYVLITQSIVRAAAAGIAAFAALAILKIIERSTVRPASMAGPRRLLREGVIHLIVFFLIGVIIMVGLVVLRPLAVQFWGSYSVFFALWFGLNVGFVMICESSWLRHFAMCAVEGSRRRLPYRLAAFLDWCCSVGLMRVSGLSVQFRHREFQDWLTTKGRDPNELSAGGLKE